MAQWQLQIKCHFIALPLEKLSHANFLSEKESVMAKHLLIKATRQDISFSERYDAYTMPVPFSGCWLWIGSVTKKGYGCFCIKNKLYRAHVASYKYFKGETNGLNVLHKCDTPLCVNPDHLFLGTHADNIKDMDNKGRRKTVRGEAHGGSILTQQQVEEIRSFPKGRGTGVFLSKKYGVSNQTISHVRSGFRWVQPKQKVA